MHINELLRQRARAADPAKRRLVQKVGAFVFSAEAEPNRRTVHTAFDWLEAYASSVLPAQVQAAQDAAPNSNTELDERLELLRQSCVYLVAAFSYFRPARDGLAAEPIINYLEAHRMQCADSGAPLSEPDQNMLLRTNARVSAALERAPSRASSDAGPGAASGPKRSYDHCGHFNRTGNCPYGAKCKYPHMCAGCKQEGHGKHACPNAAGRPDAGRAAGAAARRE